jgi:DNA-directed RNA polymerase specialized sigma24 family protein
MVRLSLNVVHFGRGTMSPTNPDILEPFRRYLEVLACVHLDSQLRGKLDPADVVQQVLMRACAALPEVRNRTPEVLAAWLRKILARTLAETAREEAAAAVRRVRASAQTARPVEGVKRAERHLPRRATGEMRRGNRG